MNATYRRVPTRFYPETRFQLKPIPAATFRANLETKFERLKEQLLRERLELPLKGQFNSQVRRAANEAAAMAWLTAFPLLVFPVLFDEKVQQEQIRFERQQDIRERSRELLTV